MGADLKELAQFIQDLHDLGEGAQVRAVFRAAHKEAGAEMRRLVHSKLPYSKKVKYWQEDYYGSGGGYAAVRPEKGDYNGYAKGHITNAIESGHWVRSRKSTKSTGYHRRTGRARVEGLHFYAAARSQVKAMGDKKAREVKDQLESKLKELGG